MSPVTVYVDIELKELIPIFISGRKQDIQKLRFALADKNFRELKKLGHSLKGVGGGYGFDFITELGDEIERAANKKDENHIQSLINTMEGSLDNLEIIYE